MGCMYVGKEQKGQSKAKESGTEQNRAGCKGEWGKERRADAHAVLLIARTPGREGTGLTVSSVESRYQQ